MPEKAKNDEVAENIRKGLLPNGMEKEVSIVINPEPNLHLNLGKH